MRIGLSTGLVMSLFLTFTSISSVHAATDDQVIDALRAQLSALTERLEALEALEAREPRSKVSTQTYTSPQPTSLSGHPSVSSNEASWTKDIKLKGDFRYRHDAFDVENETDRHRQRIRARTELNAMINENVTVGFGLATGGDDPASTNQTLGDGSSSKNVALDLAYVNWTTPIDGLAVRGGKFKNPFHRAGGNGLIWDSDLRPEGAGLTFKRENFFVNALGLFIEEDSSGEDAVLIGGQFGINAAIGDGELLAGAGYYNFTDTEGREVIYDGNPRGNRVNPDGTYLSGFELLEGFADYSFAIANSDVTLFANYVKNLDANDYDTGYALGAKVKQSRWQLGWAYQDLEADAVIGTLTDSDFIGGGTDGKGHILQASYALSKQIGLKGTFFLNDRNVDFGTEQDFKRLMLDISFKY